MTDYLPDLEPVDGGGAHAALRSSAKVGDTNAEALYYLAIASAQRSIELTAAYFVPRPAFTQALCDAAERGVDVRVLVPGPTSTRSSCGSAGRASYQRLLDAGVAAVRVPADDAAREDAGRRRHLVVRGDGQLRQPLFPASRRGHAGGLGRALRRPAPRGVRARSRASRARSSLSAGGAARPRSGSARPRPPCSAASSDRAYPAGRARTRPRRGGWARSRAAHRCVVRRRRHPVLAALGDADQAVLRLLRTRGHQEPVEVAMRALGMTGEYGAVWAAVGVVGATIDRPPRRPVAARRRGRPRSPSASTSSSSSRSAASARCSRNTRRSPGRPTKLSFPSAHATSSVAAATALGRVEPRARPYLFAARGGDLRRASLPGHALPVRRPRRRGARLLPRPPRPRAWPPSAPRSGSSTWPSMPTSASRRAAAPPATAAPRRPSARASTSGPEPA